MASDRWDVYRLLCDGLAMHLGRPAPAFATELSWKSLIELSSRHFATPALASALQGAAGVPADAAEYLDAILVLNRQRNRRILRTLGDALDILAAADIRVVLLKGAAALADGLYADPGARVLSDIDLLLPAARLDEATRLLRAGGFLAHDGSHAPFEHHLAPLRHGESGIFVELHREVLQDGIGLVTAEAILRDAVPVAVAGHTAWIASPAQRFTHALAHTQIQDGNHRWHTPMLQQMLELALLSNRDRGSIDWDALAATFRAAGHFAVLQETLQILQALFGVAMPEQIAPPAHDPIAAVRGRLGRNSILPVRLLWRYARAVQRRPARLAQLLDLRAVWRFAAALTKQSGPRES